MTVGGALEAGNLTPALDLYADIILRPGLHEEQFQLARQLAVDEVLSLDDDPRQKVMLKLQEQFYPSPLGRSTVGHISDLEALTGEKTRQIIEKNFSFSQTIFAAAGKYDFDAICGQLRRQNVEGWRLLVAEGEQGLQSHDDQHAGHRHDDADRLLERDPLVQEDRA